MLRRVCCSHSKCFLSGFYHDKVSWLSKKALLCLISDYLYLQWRPQKSGVEGYLTGSKSFSETFLQPGTKLMVQRGLPQHS